jgi:hypothetical protein
MGLKSARLQLINWINPMEKKRIARRKVLKKDPRSRIIMVGVRL